MIHGLLLTSNKLKASLMASMAILAVFIAMTGLVSAASESPPANVPDIQSSTCQGADLRFPSGPPTGKECAFADSKPEAKLNSLVATIVNLFSVIVGVVAVLMIIVGGFRYITSGGDSSNVTGAKNTILYAIVGLVIVALAQFIVKFVLSKATGVAT